MVTAALKAGAEMESGLFSTPWFLLEEINHVVHVSSVVLASKN